MNLSLRTPVKAVLPAPVKAIVPPKASVRRFEERRETRAREQLVSAWLRSPPHRANILHPRFRDLGAALVRADGVFYGGAAVVWIAAFASPR